MQLRLVLIKKHLRIGIHSHSTLRTKKCFALKFSDTCKLPRQLQNKKTMAFYGIAVLLTVIATLVQAQRPFYAGLRPIGYPETESNGLANRFGSDEPGPIEFQGDPNYRNRVQQLPPDQQPFWYLNWQQYDALRRNPQTYPQRPSVFNNKIAK